MSEIKNKVIWITGASSGIGEALAYELAKKGGKLILSARRKYELERVKGNCPFSSQANIRTLPLNITESSTIALHVQAAVQLFGHVDILVNNAGISQRSNAIDTLMEVDRKIMEVNYFGTVTLTKNLLPHFLQRKSGHIVTVTSVVGKFGTPYRSGYAASKHALHGFFDSLRSELWREVRGAIKVTMICPGFVHTALSVHAITGDGTELGKMDDAQYTGMPADWCARKIARAIEKNKEEVYFGGREVLAVYVKRFLPGLFSMIIRKAKVR